MLIKEQINAVLIDNNLSDAQKLDSISKLVNAVTVVISKQIYEGVLTCEDKLVVLRAAYNKSKGLERFIRNQQLSWNAVKKAHVRTFASSERATEYFNDIVERD